MIMDERGEFCDATALDTGGTGLALIGDVIDLEVARDIGNGQPVYVVFQVDTDVDSAADGATVEFQVVSDAQAAIATDGTATEHLKTSDFAQATLVAGFTVVYVLPTEGESYERFLGILQNVGTEAVTAGKVNIFLSLDTHGWKSHADADN